MNKPKILKGEVEEFIDITKWKNNNNTEIIRDFYSQPFKPEMITEYFEGWINEPPKWILHRENWEETENIEWHYRTEKDDAISWDGELWLNQEPNIAMSKTLSQFITNCIQAGIRLTWRKK